MPLPEGFHYIDVKKSGGPEVKDNSSLLILYRIALSEDDLRNDKSIETTYSPDIPIPIKVNKNVLLSGIYHGLIGMRGGGSIRVIVIPPEMGYGSRGYGNVPPNTTLYAEVCVVSVEE